MCYKRNLTSVPNIFLSSCIYRVAKNRLISIWCFVLQNQMYLYRVLFCKRLKLGLAGKVLSGIYQLSFCNSSKIHGLWFDLIQDAEEFFPRNCLRLRESLFRQLCFLKEFSQRIHPCIHITKTIKKVIVHLPRSFSVVLRRRADESEITAWEESNYDLNFLPGTNLI